ncbi:NAD(P)-binding protein [Rhizobium sp. RAF56]|uniref:NAD(P)-binding protein n=1 Tax=Rhizobium sp. RAF56 TaxID=3233062 RepID=UPI003F94816F
MAIAKYDYIILGCGISALTAAKRLCDGQHSILIVEHYREPGGNHQSQFIDGMEFDIGSIYFNSDDEQFRHFPELLQECRAMNVLVKKICTTGDVGNYPFDWHIDGRPRNATDLLSSLWSLLLGRFNPARHDDAGRYARSRIGDVFYRRVGLDLYIKRLFGVDAAKIDLDFALKRMQWLSRETSLRYRLRRLLGRSMTKKHRTEYSVVRLPGGFARYYDRAVSSLEQRGVKFLFDDTILALESCDSSCRLQTTSGDHAGTRLISTIPLGEMARLCHLPDPDLPAVTLLSLFVSLRGAWMPACSVLYNFHTRGNWKRITLHSDFYQAPGQELRYFTVEITVPPGAAAPVSEAAFGEVVAHLRALKIVEGDLALMGSRLLANAYPVPEKGFKPRRDSIVQALAEKGVLCIGRQGKFEYIPHSNVAAKEAIASLEKASPLRRI